MLASDDKQRRSCIAGYPGCEFQIRAALTTTIGKDKADFFFDKVRASMLLFRSMRMLKGTIVSRVLLCGARGCLLQVARVELHPRSSELQTFRG